MKLDSKFYGTIKKVKNGQLVGNDEYMVFLAKDTAFANILPKYLDECRRLGADAEHLDAVGRTIVRVTQWRAMHPHQCKVPDAKSEALLDDHRTWGNADIPHEAFAGVHGEPEPS